MKKYKMNFRLQKAGRFLVGICTILAITLLSPKVMAQNASPKAGKHKPALAIHANMRDRAVHHIGNHHRMINHSAIRPHIIRHIKKTDNSRHLIRKPVKPKQGRSKTERMIHKTHNSSFHRLK